MHGGKLDLEWVELIIEAKDLGISLEEIESFLLETKTKRETEKKKYDFIESK
ncbi:anti-repressor SinI family protein [Salirhabdus sp. Marseille-P4669]|uniref:anti-repressor SinI family protein n=1 Tax=Salirhabdus sp. Marseille-P4669 TaxID=2042310 RepID=UPI000C7DC9F3|nr:anti-repressor SinI family protein [Salirhabdus sp. Marseille-P4669]